MPTTILAPLEITGLKKTKSTIERILETEDFQKKF